MSGRKRIAPKLSELVDMTGFLAHAEKRDDDRNAIRLARTELNALLAVAKQAYLEHGPATREIDSEDHRDCTMCAALRRLERASKGTT